MITTYLVFGGNAKEAVDYYSKVFDGNVSYMMRYNDMPEKDKEEMKGMEDAVIHANVDTFVGQIMLSDSMPDEKPTPSDALWINVSHEDLDKLKEVFDAMAEEGEVIMPLEETFFSPLYGQVKDKYGFYWMIMSSEE